MLYNFCYWRSDIFELIKDSTYTWSIRWCHKVHTIVVITEDSCCFLFIITFDWQSETFWSRFPRDRLARDWVLFGTLFNVYEYFMSYHSMIWNLNFARLDVLSLKWSMKKMKMTIQNFFSYSVFILNIFQLKICKFPISFHSCYISLYCSLGQQVSFSCNIVTSCNLTWMNSNEQHRCHTNFFCQ